MFPRCIGVCLIVVVFILPMAAIRAAIFVGDKGKIIEQSGKLKPRWEYVSSRFYRHTPPPLILAVQGGATHTMGVLFRYDTKIFRFKEVYRKQLEGSSLNHAPERALSVVKQFISDNTEAYPSENMTVVMGMAGSGFAEGRGLFLSGLVESPKVVRAVLTSDAETAWLSVFDNEGLIIIAGTGGITLGVNRHGQTYMSGGFGGPVSDYPSATSLVFDYDRCSDALSCFKEGQLEVLTPMPLLKQWIKQKGGSASHFFAYRSKLLTTGKNDEYASRAKDIITFYKQHIAGQYDLKKAGSLSINAKKSTTGGFSPEPKDYCVAYAMNKAVMCFKEELMARNSPEFKKVPFAFDGSVADELWQILEKQQQTQGLKQRKSPLKPNLIVGALRLIYEDIPVAKFRRMMDAP
ncbi:hypothetical protein N9V90_00895 [Endozoicomonas sp.]|nr:hypothetical protein [Endozoicomonas sp.]